MVALVKKVYKALWSWIHMLDGLSLRDFYMQLHLVKNRWSKRSTLQIPSSDWHTLALIGLATSYELAQCFLWAQKYSSALTHQGMHHIDWTILLATWHRDRSFLSQIIVGLWMQQHGYFWKCYYLLSIVTSTNCHMMQNNNSIYSTFIEPKKMR